MKGSNTIAIVNTDGVKTVFEVLLTFENITTNRNYIIYTDNTRNLDGNMNVFASIYDPSNPLMLKPITTDVEWEYVENILHAAQKDYLQTH